MPSYLLLEDGGRITLEDSSGFVLLELQDVTQVPAGGGKRHGGQGRRRFTFADGREIEITSDAQLKKIIRELTKSKTVAKKPRTKKDTPKPPQLLPVPKIDPNIILQMLDAMNQFALTEQGIIMALDRYLQGIWDDEDDVAVLLLQ